MKIREMELLMRVAEAGSMTLAAQQLHLTRAAVSATVQRIEASMDVRLFERTTRAIRPTDEGLVVLDGCQATVDQWHLTLEAVHGITPALTGTVHISAPADTSYQVLAPVIVTLADQHPTLQVVLHTSDSVQHMHRDAIDMAIRYGPLPDSTLSARKLIECPVLLVAAPAYVARHGVPETPQALKDHRCVTLKIGGTPVTNWRLIGKGKDHTIALESPPCADGYLTRLWAVEGVGIAFKSLFDVIDDLETGRLVRVLADYTVGSMAIHAVFPSRHDLPGRVRAVDQAVATHFAARAERCHAWLSSRQNTAAAAESSPHV